MRLLVVPGIAASVLTVWKDVLVPNCCRSGRQTAMAGSVTTSALVEVERAWELVQIFALADLTRVFQAVGLLDEEHVTMVLRSLYYFRHGLARVQVDFHVLVVLWRLRSWVWRHLLLLWSTVSSAEATESGLIQLLLPLKARVSISYADFLLHLWLLVVIERASGMFKWVTFVVHIIYHRVQIRTFRAISYGLLSVWVWE